MGSNTVFHRYWDGTTIICRFGTDLILLSQAGLIATKNEHLGIVDSVYRYSINGWAVYALASYCCNLPLQTRNAQVETYDQLPNIVA